jgi:hypothetical protein
MNSNKLAVRCFIFFLALQILLPFPLFADVIGKFNEIKGNVSLFRGKKGLIPNVGDDVHTKDVITTGDKARAKLLLTDDSLLSVGQNSNLEMKEYLLDKDKRSGVVFLKIGTLHTNVEKFLNPNSKFEVHTPTAVAGARGTAWLTLVELAAQSAAKSSFYALSQSIFVLSPAFPAQVATVAAGNFTVVAAGALPTAAATFAPATIQGIMGQLGATMPGAGIGGGTGAAGAGAGSGAGTGGAGAGAAGAGAGAGAGVGAGVGAGTIAAGAVAAAGVAAGVAAVTSSSGGGTTPTTHHH